MSLAKVWPLSPWSGAGLLRYHAVPLTLRLLMGGLRTFCIFYSPHISPGQSLDPDRAGGFVFSQLVGLDIEHLDTRNSRLEKERGDNQLSFRDPLQEKKNNITSCNSWYLQENIHQDDHNKILYLGFAIIRPLKTSASNSQETGDVEAITPLPVVWLTSRHLMASYLYEGLTSQL